MFAIQRTISYASGKTMRMFYKETTGFGVELTSSLEDAHKFEDSEAAKDCISSISSPAGFEKFKILELA